MPSSNLSSTWGANACATSLTLRRVVRLARLMCSISESSSMAKDTLLLRSNNVYPCYGALPPQCGHYSYDVTIGVGKLSDPRILLRTYVRRHIRCRSIDYRLGYLAMYSAIARYNSAIAQCHCSYRAMYHSYRVMCTNHRAICHSNRAMCHSCRAMYHSYRVMRVIYCAMWVMWPTSCTMRSSPILKQTAYHRGVPPDPPHTIHFVGPPFLYLPWGLNPLGSPDYMACLFHNGHKLYTLEMYAFLIR